MCAATNSSDIRINDLKTQRWNKLIVAGCIVIVAWYLHRFIINKGNYTDPIVQIKNGRIRGRIGISRGGREFYEFLGIPFAKPPVGPLRFMSPQPVDDWKGLLNTRRFRPKCMQVDLISQLKSGSDDCLYLNVFMPKLKLGRNLTHQKPLPVIVFIHGGYYVSGHTSLYSGKYIFENENIVLVSITYRLGALGFLNLGIKDARGNQGLKDQVLALKWVQENIHVFNGDPNSVTIMGQSAGGSSVHFHMLSPKSKGLFNKAVSHSGTILSPWAISYKPKEQAFRLGKMLDCPVNDSHATLDCLKKKDVNKIVEVHSEILNFLHDPFSVFKPTIEEIDDEDAFLTQDPLELMKAGNISSRVPWMVGVNREEGLAVASVLVRDNSMLQEFQKDWRTNFRKLLLYSTDDDSVAGKIRSYYFGSQPNFCTQSNLGNFTKMFSEREYFQGTHQSAVYHHSVEKSSPVYLFYYAQPIPLSFGDVLWAQYGIFPAFVEIGVYLAYAWVQRNIFGMFNAQKGVTHVDDLTMIFHIFNIPEYDGDDGWNRLSKEMVKSWVEFARSGEPAPIFGVKWNHAFSKEAQQQHSMPTSEQKGLLPVPQYLKITIDSPAMVDEPFNEAIAFWSSLNITEYRGPKLQFNDTKPAPALNIKIKITTVAWIFSIFTCGVALNVYIYGNYITPGYIYPFKVSLSNRIPKYAGIPLCFSVGLSMVWMLVIIVAALFLLIIIGVSLYGYVKHFIGGIMLLMIAGLLCIIFGILVSMFWGWDCEKEYMLPILRLIDIVTGVIYIVTTAWLSKRY